MSSSPAEMSANKDVTCGNDLACHVRDESYVIDSSSVSVVTTGSKSFDNDNDTENLDYDDTEITSQHDLTYEPKRALHEDIQALEWLRMIREAVSSDKRRDIEDYIQNLEAELLRQYKAFQMKEHEVEARTHERDRYQSKCVKLDMRLKENRDVHKKANELQRSVLQLKRQLADAEEDTEEANMLIESLKERINVKDNTIQIQATKISHLEEQVSSLQSSLPSVSSSSDHNKRPNTSSKIFTSSNTSSASGHTNVSEPNVSKVQHKNKLGAPSTTRLQLLRSQKHQIETKVRSSVRTASTAASTIASSDDLSGYGTFLSNSEHSNLTNATTPSTAFDNGIITISPKITRPMYSSNSKSSPKTKNAVARSVSEGLGRKTSQSMDAKNKESFLFPPPLEKTRSDTVQDNDQFANNDLKEAATVDIANSQLIHDLQSRLQYLQRELDQTRSQQSVQSAQLNQDISSSDISIPTILPTNLPYSSELDNSEPKFDMRWPIRVAELEGELEELHQKLLQAERTIVCLEEGLDRTKAGDSKENTMSTSTDTISLEVRLIETQLSYKQAKKKIELMKDESKKQTQIYERKVADIELLLQQARTQADQSEVGVSLKEKPAIDTVQSADQTNGYKNNVKVNNVEKLDPSMDEYKQKYDLMEYRLQMLKQACQVDDLSLIPSRISNLQESLKAAQTEQSRTNSDVADLIENQQCLIKDLEYAQQEIEELRRSALGNTSLNEVNPCEPLARLSSTEISIIKDDDINELRKIKAQSKVLVHQITMLQKSCQVEDLTTIPSKLSELNEALLAAHTEKERLEACISELTAENKDLSEELEIARQQMEGLPARIEQLEREFAEKEQVEVDEIFTRSETGLEQNSLHMLQLQSELDGWIAKSRKREEQIVALGKACGVDDVSQIPAKLSNLMELLSVTESDQRTSEAKLGETLEELEALKRLVQNLQEEKALAESNILTLQEQLHGAAASSAKVEAMLEGIHNLYNTEDANELLASISRDISDMVQTKERIDELQIKCGVESLDEIPIKLEGLQSEMDHLRILVNKAEQRNDGLRSCGDSFDQLERELDLLIDADAGNTRGLRSDNKIQTAGEQPEHRPSRPQRSLSTLITSSEQRTLRPRRNSESDILMSDVDFKYTDLFQNSLSRQRSGSQRRNVPADQRESLLEQAEFKVERLSKMLLESYAKTEKVERQLVQLSIACKVTNIDEIPAKIAECAEDTAAMDEMYNSLIESEYVVGELQQKLHATLDSLQQSECTVAELRNSLNETQHALMEKNDDIETQADSIQGLTEVTRVLKNELELQYTKTSALEAVVRDLTGKLEEAQRERDNSIEPKRAMDRLESILERKEREIAALQGELESISGELTKTRKLMEEIEHDRNSYSAQVNELQNLALLRNNDDIYQQLMSKCIECAQLKTSTETLQRKILVAETTAKTLNEENAEKAKLLREMGSRYGSDMTTEKFIERLEKEHERTLKRATDSSIRLAECQMRIDELLAEVKNLKKKSSTEILEDSEQSPRNSKGGSNRFSFSQMRASFQSRILPGDFSSSSLWYEPDHESEAAIGRLNKKIAVLEAENQAYATSLEAFKQRREI